MTSAQALGQPLPTNPYTGEPMAQGTARGDFSYAARAGNTYALTVYLSGGATLDLNGTVP